jgi:hypothetical protein
VRAVKKRRHKTVLLYRRFPFQSAVVPFCGIGEKFTADPATGTGSMTVPIYSSRDRSGFGPQLTLFGYAVAVVAVGGAVVATLELSSAVKDTPTLFFCSVILSNWFGGAWPGIFAGRCVPGKAKRFHQRCRPRQSLLDDFQAVQNEYLNERKARKL